MNILDENVPEQQRRLLLSWHVLFRQIGYEVERKGIGDDEIIPFLLRLNRPTFFTRDMDFCKRALRHARYCLVILDVAERETAFFMRRFLRHPEFDTQEKRLGAVIRVSREGLSAWRLHAEQEAHYSWSDADGRMLSSVIREDEGLYVVEYSEHDADFGPDQGYTGGGNDMSATFTGQYIVADPEICHGKPTFRGTRIMVWQVLGMLAKGQSWEAITKAWGGRVTPEYIAEALQFASEALQKPFQEQTPEPLPA